MQLARRSFTALLIAAGLALPSARAAIAQQSTDVSIGLQVNILSQVVKVVLNKKNLVQRHGGAFKINWVQTTSGPILNEAFAANTLQMGFQAGPPFLIAWSHGIPIKVASDAGILPSDLVACSPKLRTLADIPPGSKIALPAPGSLQDIALQMGAENAKLNPATFFADEVAMPQADGLQGLIAGQLTALFGAPPYTALALENPACHSILSVKDSYGGKYPYHLLVATVQFATERPKDYAALVAAVQDALLYAKTNPDEVADLLHDENPKISSADLKRDLTNPGTQYSLVPGGLMKTAAFMTARKMIPKAPATVGEITFPNLRGAN